MAGYKGMGMNKKIKKSALNIRVSSTTLSEFRLLATLLDKNLGNFFEEALSDLIKKYDQNDLIVELRKLKTKAKEDV